MESHRSIRSSVPLALAVLLCGCILDLGDDSGQDDRIIEGYVRDELGSPVAAVSVKAYLSYEEMSLSATTCSVRTDSRGFYRIPYGPSVMAIALLPSKPGCVFRPPKVSYYQPAGALRNEDFTAVCGGLHTISGHVLDIEGDPVSGVAITIRDDLHRWDKTVFTGADGLYTISNVVPDLNYKVTPLLAAYEFVPPARAYDSLGSDFEDQDFIAIVESFPDSPRAD